MLPVPRFPPRGPCGRSFPRFVGTTEALRPPDAHPGGLRFPSPARYRGCMGWASSLPPPTHARRRARGWSAGIPIRLVSAETPGSPKFLGNPHSRSPMLSDHGRPIRPRPIARRPRGPRFWNGEGADKRRLSRLNSVAFGLAAYVSPVGYPTAGARLASRCWSGSPGRA